MVDPQDLVAWLKAFALTEIIETPLYRHLVPTDLRRGFVASAITHPFVWFVFPWLGDLTETGYLPTSIASELFAWLVEAIWLRWMPGPRVSWPRALAAAFVANCASLGIGLIVRATTDLV